MSKQQAKYWMGSPPVNCDICHKPFGDSFTDGATTMGPWGNMCSSCFTKFGVGLGTGRGQRYEKQKDGRWLKTQ
jgi:hypothetical protein